MESIIYFLADLYPWWGLPLAFIFFEVANRHRRRGVRGKMLFNLTISFVLVALAIAYFFYNGMENLRPAMQELERMYLNK